MGPAVDREDSQAGQEGLQADRVVDLRRGVADRRLMALLQVDRRPMVHRRVAPEDLRAGAGGLEGRLEAGRAGGRVGGRRWYRSAKGRRASTSRRMASSSGRRTSRDGRISVIDIASKKVVATIDAGARGANRLKFTPDGKLALVSELGGGGIVVLETGTHTVMKRVPLGHGASGILIPPDGARAYIALTGDNTVAVIDLKTLSEVARLNTGPGPDGMAWLPAKRE